MSELPVAGTRRPVAGWWPAPAGGLDLAPLGVATGLACLATALRWRGGDLPAQLLRARLFDLHGFAPWNGRWFSGHSTAGYSVLFPAVAGWFGPSLVGVASVVVCGASGVAVARRLAPARAGLAATWFATGMVANLAVGRLTFAMGLAIASACVAALVHGRGRSATVLAVLAPLASPVAAVCLALVAAAAAIGLDGSQRRARLRCLVVAAAALLPLGLIALLFPGAGGGSFPFTPGAFVVSLAVCGALWCVAPAADRSVRAFAVLYAAASVVVFAVPNPLGGNLTRVGMFLAGPALIAVARPRHRRLLLVLVPLLLWWQWSPAIDGVFRGGSDPSAASEYHRPLLDFVASAGREGRIEVVPTRRHWETYHVAAELPLARGWERQTDRRLNPLFYGDGLSGAAYREWLTDNAVRWVALADVDLDDAGRGEAALLSTPPPYLRPVWSDEHWQVWEFTGASDLVSGPGQLVSWGSASVVLAADGPGTLLVREHASPSWRVVGGTASGACVRDDAASDWLRVEVAGPGTVVLEHRVLGPTTRCDGG